MNDKQLFLDIYNENINRKGSDKLLQWLEKTDFFIAPASSRFHLSCEGGLVKHSINVYNRMKKIYIMEYGEQSITDEINETLTIISLLHDICKVNFYKVDYRNTKNEAGVWEKVPYYTTDEKLCYGYHGCKSVFLIERFMKLEVEEAVCISNHMGAFDRPVGDFSLSNAYNQYPLAFLLHSADCFATFIDEKEI